MQDIYAYFMIMANWFKNWWATQINTTPWASICFIKDCERSHGVISLTDIFQVPSFTLTGNQWFIGVCCSYFSFSFTFLSVSHTEYLQTMTPSFRIAPFMTIFHIWYLRLSWQWIRKLQSSQICCHVVWYIHRYQCLWGICCTHLQVSTQIIFCFTFISPM